LEEGLAINEEKWVLFFNDWIAIVASVCTALKYGKRGQYLYNLSFGFKLKDP